MIYAPGWSLAAVSLITSDANKGLEHLGPGAESLWACQGPTWATSCLGILSQPVATVTSDASSRVGIQGHGTTLSSSQLLPSPG